jgi:hypothetical protein
MLGANLLPTLRPPRITPKSCRRPVSDRTMVGTFQPVWLVTLQPPPEGCYEPTMHSRSPLWRSPLRTPSARAKTKTRTNQLWSGNRQGLDDETKTSDSPVQGEVFLLTSPIIELSESAKLGQIGSWQARAGSLNSA